MPGNVFPPAFENRMKVTLGQEWPDFVQAHEQPLPVSIRINPYKGKPGIGKRIPWTDFGFYLPSRPSFTLDPALHAGAYYVQEASSMFLEQALKQSTELDQPLRVLDLCAAPGGKSTHLLSMIHKDSLLVSNEVIRSRAQILAENIQKWGCSNVIVTNSDPEAFQKLNGFFDVIVVDAPCSGEGLFRKDPEAAKEWSEDHIALCSTRQRRILDDVWPALRENGLLVYSTCTFNTIENEDTLTWLAEKQSVEFINLEIQPAWGIEKITLGKAIGYRFYPHRIEGEGFFISVVRKLDVEPEIRIRPGRNFALASRNISDQLKTWTLNPEEYKIIRQENLLIQIPSKWFDEMAYISNQLHVVNKGTAVAEIKHDKLIPEHSIALSTQLNRTQFHSINLDLEQALSYLRKESLLIGEGEKGFALVTFDGYTLGWVNLLGNRVNNLYPSAWRIRMSS
jgi:NOL1/NOP2/sun family putative RNA methylase